ncbi:MAG: hypothetical protein LBH43_05230 [Treponema sp.]|jgi:hypothetical protein|nr:hypothetical protein [Treponema sp.]
MNLALALAAVSVILCFLFFLYFRWYIKKRISIVVLLADYWTEVDRLIAEIDAAADRDERLVEDRIKTLRQILEETDKRISVYLRDLERSRSGTALYTSLGRGPRAVYGQTETAEPKSAGQQATAPTQAAQIAEPVIQKAEPTDKIDDESGKASRAEKPELRVLINEMAARGMTMDQIASELKISLSEVDLALNLVRRG